MRCRSAAKLWDTATGKNTATLLGHSLAVRSVAFSPDGKTLASGSGDHTIKLWDVRTSKNTVTFRYGAPVMCVAFSPDGKTLASTGGGRPFLPDKDNTLKLWDLATGRHKATLKGHVSI